MDAKFGTLYHILAFSLKPMVFENNGINPMWREAWSQKEDALRQRYMRHMEKLDSGSRLLEPL